MVFTEFNPDYVFEKFIVDEGNQKAYAAAKAAALGVLGYNPLVIVGKKGTGKTHLLQAIAKAVDCGKALYVPASDFISIKSAFDKAMPQGFARAKKFFDELGKADVLLIDDLQLFIEKECPIEELRNIMYLFFTKGKQIVITANNAPGFMKGQDEALAVVQMLSRGLTIGMERHGKKGGKIK